MNDRDMVDRLEELKLQLEFLQELGVDFLICSAEPVGEKKPDSSELIQLETSDEIPVNEEAEWEKLIKQIMDCQFCPLFKTRTQAVPGEGNRKAQLMFVGEAPGKEEDLQGRPFVGRAGQLLTRIIKAMGFERNQVYIANVVKCRPPENRTPRPDEIKACSLYLIKQIDLIKPKIIVALGKVAAEFLLPSTKSMTELRGNFDQYQGIPVMPTFHPSYLIRNEGNQKIKKMVWEDMKKVMKLLGA
jgi:DNA polymerase